MTVEAAKQCADFSTAVRPLSYAADNSVETKHPLANLMFNRCMVYCKPSKPSIVGLHSSTSSHRKPKKKHRAKKHGICYSAGSSLGGLKSQAQEVVPSGSVASASVARAR